MKNVYFLSDAHLGSLAIPHARMQERRLVRFLCLCSPKIRENSDFSAELRKRNQNRLVEFNRIAVRNENFGNASARFARYLVHELHALDNEQHVSLIDRASDAYKRRFSGSGRGIERSDDRRFNESSAYFFFAV